MMMYKDKYADTGDKPQNGPAPMPDEDDLFDFLSDKDMPELSAEDLVKILAEEIQDIPLEDPAQVQQEEEIPVVPSRREQRYAAAAERRRKQKRNHNI